MRKESRKECMFCKTFNKCRRLEVNDIIIRTIKKTGHCPDMILSSFNPSMRYPQEVKEYVEES